MGSSAVRKKTVLVIGKDEHLGVGVASSLGFSSEVILLRSRVDSVHDARAILRAASPDMVVIEECFIKAAALEGYPAGQVSPPTVRATVWHDPPARKVLAASPRHPRRVLADQDKVRIVNRVLGLTQGRHACGLTAKQIAQKVNASTSYIARTFKEVVGRSLSEHLRRQKLFAVQETLRDSNKSVKEIASELHFRNADYLCVWFKSQTGKTPLEFRAVNREPRKNTCGNPRDLRACHEIKVHNRKSKTFELS